MLLLHVKCCHKYHISDVHLSFVPMLTVHLINLDFFFLPQYTTYIAKIILTMYYNGF